VSLRQTPMLVPEDAAVNVGIVHRGGRLVGGAGPVQRPELAGPGLVRPVTRREQCLVDAEEEYELLRGGRYSTRC
jgi:hypothetical protein